MKKVFLIFIVIINILFANELITQSKIFPYLLIYDKELKDKMFENKINFLIIYDKFSKNSANKLKELIMQEHNGKLNDYNLTVTLIDNPKLEYLKEATAIYLFDIKESYIEKVTKFAKKNKIITFAHTSNMLKEDVAISILITKKVQPFINLKVLKDSGIKLSYKIFKVSKIYE